MKVKDLIKELNMIEDKDKEVVISFSMSNEVIVNREVVTVSDEDVVYLEDLNLESIRS